MSDDATPSEPTALQSALNRSPQLVMIAVAGLLITTVTSFGWSVAKSIQLVVDVVDGQWKSDLAVVKLLGVIDMYLIAVVQLIVVIGLYELFVAELRVPEWLRVDSLNDLKKSIIDILVVFVAVKAIEGILKQPEPVDGLFFSLSAAVIILVLTLFRWQASLTKGAKG